MVLEFTPEEFRRIRQQAQEQYPAYSQVHCPYFQGNVHFNTEGFRHLLFKNWNRGRDRRTYQLDRSSTNDSSVWAAASVS